MNTTTRNSALTGTVLEIQRMSTEDGPGLRTTIFLKGCSLRCAWCHNPESLERKPQIQWLGSRCIGCRLCLAACARGALTATDDGIAIDRELCRGCGTCADQCPSTALELLGREWTVEDLLAEVLKDSHFFGTGGGVTASGGEAALQAPFVAALFRGLHERGIHTALDTSGQCGRDGLDLILPHSDLVMYDIKEIDDARHREFTGSGNGKILENIAHVAEFVRGHLLPRELWIRTPVIPGATAREDTIAGIGRFIAGRLGGAVARWELCAFNNLCRDKYRRLGMAWTFDDACLMTRTEMERLAEVARTSGVDPAIVAWTGSTELTAEEKAAAPVQAAKRPASC